MLHLGNCIIELMITDREVVVADSVHNAYDSLTVSKTANGVALSKIAARDERYVWSRLEFGIALTRHTCVAFNSTMHIVLVEDHDRLRALTGDEQESKEYNRESKVE